MKINNNCVRDMAFFIFGLLIFSLFLLTGCASTEPVIKKCPKYEYTKTLIASKNI